MNGNSSNFVDLFTTATGQSIPYADPSRPGKPAAPRLTHRALKFLNPTPPLPMQQRKP